MTAHRQDTIDKTRLPLFYQDWWLDLVCGADQWKSITYRDGDGRVWGYWPISSIRKAGQELYLSPDLTPFNGPVIFYPENLVKRERRYSHEHKVLNGLLDQLPKATAYRFRCVPEVNNWLPFYNNGFRQTTQYTYQIDGIKDLDTVRSNYKSSVRNDIQYAQKNYDLISCKTAEEVLPVIDATHHRKYKQTPHIAKQIITTTLANECGAAWLVQDKDSRKTVAGGHIVWDHDKAYLLLLGVDKTQSPRGAVQLLIDHLIKEASSMVDTFDFEGSMIQEVEPVYRAFGGRRVPYSIVSKASWWYDLLFMLLRKKAW